MNEFNYLTYGAEYSASFSLAFVGLISFEMILSIYLTWL